MPVLLTFDVSTNQTAITQELRKLGYTHTLHDSTNRPVYLPATTLVTHRAGATAQTAVDDLRRAINNVNALTPVRIVLERAFTTEFGPAWSGIFGVATGL